MVQPNRFVQLLYGKQFAVQRALAAFSFIRHRDRFSLIGKGNKVRVIALDPYAGYELMRGLPVFARKPFLFWHSEGETHKNFARQFAAIIRRTAAWAREAGVDFRPFHFHDLSAALAAKQATYTISTRRLGLRSGERGRMFMFQAWPRVVNNSRMLVRSGENVALSPLNMRLTVVDFTL
jgi:integrase